MIKQTYRSPIAAIYRVLFINDIMTNLYLKFKSNIIYLNLLKGGSMNQTIASNEAANLGEQLILHEKQIYNTILRIVGNVEQMLINLELRIGWI